MRDAIKSVLITVLCFAVFLAIYVIGEISGWFKKADNLAIIGIRCLSMIPKIPRLKKLSTTSNIFYI